MWDPQITIEVVTDPAAIEKHREQREQFVRNSEWLQAHWPNLMPQAAGRFVAVAGQEAFLASSADEAWAWVERVHPDDRGPVVQYVLAGKGPRSYAHRWFVVDV